MRRPYQTFDLPLPLPLLQVLQLHFSICKHSQCVYVWAFQLYSINWKLEEKFYKYKNIYKHKNICYSIVYIITIDLVITSFNRNFYFSLTLNVFPIDPSEVSRGHSNQLSSKCIDIPLSSAITTCSSANESQLNFTVSFKTMPKLKTSAILSK
jgi:hypothetical protein